MQTAGAVSHFQKAVLHIGDYLIYLSLGLVVAADRGADVSRGAAADLVQFVLILVVASIPVAMPAVLSVTMALGALALSRMKAIVTRLESIEEMAGVDMLCSDKTGTLTQNRLTLGEPVTVRPQDAQAVILAAALASKAENQDAIDQAVIGGLADKDGLERLCDRLEIHPFRPDAQAHRGDASKMAGKTFKVTKGAPQVILRFVSPGRRDAGPGPEGGGRTGSQGVPHPGRGPVRR